MALGLFASPAIAAPPPTLQFGFVCNSEIAIERMRSQMKELIEAHVTDPAVIVAMSVGRISTPRNWCIEGVVKAARPSHEVFDANIVSMEIVAGVMGIVPHVGGLLANHMSQHISAIPRTHSYETERGRTMFFVSAKHRIERSVERKYDPVLDQLIAETVKAHEDTHTLGAAIARTIREYRAKNK